MAIALTRLRFATVIFRRLAIFRSVFFRIRAGKTVKFVEFSLTFRRIVPVPFFFEMHVTIQLSIDIGTNFQRNTVQTVGVNIRKVGKSGESSPESWESS